MGHLLQNRSISFLSLILLLVALFSPVVQANVLLSEFFPFGTEHGDVKALVSDDGSTNFTLTSSFGFPFFNDTYNQLWVNNNGGISFKRAINAFTPVCGALDETSTMIAPFWADVDTRNGGDIFFRETSNRTLLSQASAEIQNAFPDLWGASSGSLFIVTWFNVSFYGSRSNSGCGDPRNTFQVVLSTDGAFSFAIFYYNQLTWTTGTESGGNSCGLGGLPAKAGFDVGDGETFFQLPDSCTNNILRAVNQSNVNYPGKWVFRVDNTFQASGCDSEHYQTEKLQMSPSFVGPFGHVPLTLKGPCLDTAVSATCRFNDLGLNKTMSTNVSAVINRNESLVLCEVPYLYSYGRLAVDLFVLERNETEEVQYTGYLYTMDTEPGISTEFGGINAAGEVPISLTWDSNYFNSSAPVLLDIILVEYKNGVWSENRTVRSNVTNSGRTNFTLKSVEQELITFRVRPTSGNGGSQTQDFFDLSWAKSAFTQVKFWFTKGSEDAQTLCDAWYEKDPGPPTDIEPCPPLLELAQSDPRFEKDSNEKNLGDFHPGAAYSFRQTTPSASGAGQQCVYDKNGKIMVGPPGGGTADLSSPSKWWNIPAHFFDDVIPWYKCCKYSDSDAHCRKYYEKRPSDSGETYIAPRPGGGSGDPHITTFDLLTYSFNGVGEFWMVKSPGFSMQGRMEQFVTEEGPTNASVFTAFAMSDSQTKVQVQFSRQRGLELLLNDEFVEFGVNSTSPLRLSTRTANVEKQGDSTRVSFTSGFAFTITLIQESLSILASASQSNRGRTTGLLGYFDGNPDNDLRTLGNTTVPGNSSLEIIHLAFGLSWMTTANESLFVYPQGRNHSSYSNPGFRPNLERPDVASIPADIVRMCNGSMDCLFDFAVTGSESFANQTREQMAVLNETVEALATEVKMCRSIYNLTNGYVNTTNFFEDSRVTFACNEGYTLVGPASVTCVKDKDGDGSNLKWSDKEPECQKADGGGSALFYPSILLVVGLSWLSKLV